MSGIILLLSDVASGTNQEPATAAHTRTATAAHTRTATAARTRTANARVRALIPHFLLRFYDVCHTRIMTRPHTALKAYMYITADIHQLHAHVL